MGRQGSENTRKIALSMNDHLGRREGAQINSAGLCHLDKAAVQHAGHDKPDLIRVGVEEDGALPLSLQRRDERGALTLHRAGGRQGALDYLQRTGQTAHTVGGRQFL